jgi:hypothetical protein
MTKLYSMTLLALVCASSISVDAKGVVHQSAANHPYDAHDEFHPYTHDTGGTGEAAPEAMEA